MICLMNLTRVSVPCSPTGQRLVETGFPLAGAAAAVSYLAAVPLSVPVNQFTIIAGSMPYIGRG